MRLDPNRTGAVLEKQIALLLEQGGFQHVDGKLKSAFAKGTLELGDEKLPGLWFMRNLKKFENIYRTRFFADFFIFHPTAYPRGLIVEVKAQDVAGSIDEKYVFTALSLKQACKEHGVSAILVMSGAGARTCAIDWIKTQANKRFQYMTESNFRQAILRLL